MEKNELMKSCMTCKKNLIIDEFISNSRKNKTYVNDCEKCREKNNIRRAKNREKERERLGNDGYHERQAKMMLNWRKNNFPKVNEWRKKDTHYHYRGMRFQAKKKGIEWDDITFPPTKAKDMMLLPCEYCGVNPVNCVHGIDRINNDCGYTLSNCVTACKECNFLKKCLDPTTFIERCKHISYIHGGKGELFAEAWPNKSSSVSFTEYETRAIHKKIQFDMSFNDFYKVIENGLCYYCKNESDGVDRKDNKKGYTTDNCVNCCKECNVMKANSNDIDFIENCKRVAQFENRSKDFSSFPRQYLTIKKRCFH